ncbi:FAD-dependent oxidoreductase [Nocardiopsis mangrovi]|uniref:FAD-dependent oxidoreductase n=1 Tax=Nocardiopsis mangrovi TaxID=1179818 RepID=A0ABV9DT46_9ACTN
MTRILIFGAGLAGLQAALVLAADGHAVTVVERDPAVPPDGAEAMYEEWERPGVSRFRMPHVASGRWSHLMARELPEVLTELEHLGAVRSSPLDLLPEEAITGARAGDEELRRVFARRPVMEGALANVTERTRGTTMRRGLTVRALRSRSGETPRVTGVVTDTGETIDADLVIDAMGRHSPERTCSNCCAG